MAEKRTPNPISRCKRVGLKSPPLCRLGSSFHPTRIGKAVDVFRKARHRGGPGPAPRAPGLRRRGGRGAHPRSHNATPTLFTSCTRADHPRVAPLPPPTLTSYSTGGPRAPAGPPPRGRGGPGRRGGAGGPIRPTAWFLFTSSD